MRNVIGCSSRYVGRVGQGTRRTPIGAAAAVEITFAGRSENSGQNRKLGLRDSSRPRAPMKIHGTDSLLVSGRDQARFQDVFSCIFNRSINTGFRAVSDTDSITGFSAISETILKGASKPILLGLRPTATGKPVGGAAWEAQRGLRRPEHPPLSNSSS